MLSSQKIKKVRVISGKAKGRKLKAPSQARPLTDRAKEALFNILRERVADCLFLDLFAGSGAVGIEALSRDGRRAVFIEENRQAIKIIKANLQVTELADLAEVYAVDAARGLKILARQEKQFNLIFVGAPYDDPALEEVLSILGEGQYLKPAGLVIAEHRKQHQLSDQFGCLKAGREARYGETVLKFYEESNLSGEL